MPFVAPIAVAVRTGLAALLALLLGLPAGGGHATEPTSTVTLQPFAVAPANASKPDDITKLGGVVYVSYQNGVNADGTPATDGTTTSTIVGFDARTGAVVATYPVTGRCDGLTADPVHHRLLASVNEDNSSSLFVITPGSAPVAYTYSPNPSEMGPGETSGNGGTDSIAIGPHGAIFVAHSNPDPGAGNTAAVYRMSLDTVGHVAHLTKLFGVQDPATVVGSHPARTTALSLTDPDSNRAIPAGAPVLGGVLVQDAQADSQLVFVRHPGSAHPQLSVLSLTNATIPSKGDATTTPQLDDIEEVTGAGTLYVVDQGSGNVYTINTAHIDPGTLFASQPNPKAGEAPNDPALSVVDPTSGVVTHLTTNQALMSPKGLLFVPNRDRANDLG